MGKKHPIPNLNPPVKEGDIIRVVTRMHYGSVIISTPVPVLSVDENGRPGIRYNSGQILNVDEWISGAQPAPAPLVEKSVLEEMTTAWKQLVHRDSVIATAIRDRERAKYTINSTTTEIRLRCRYLRRLAVQKIQDKYGARQMPGYTASGTASGQVHALQEKLRKHIEAHRIDLPAELFPEHRPKSFVELDEINEVAAESAKNAGTPAPADSLVKSADSAASDQAS